MKPATVLISGRAPGENLQDIDVPPGATALDILKAVGLDRQWTLSREGSNQVFAFEEEVYGSIEPGSKLRAAPLAEVGVGLPGWLAWLLKILGLYASPSGGGGAASTENPAAPTSAPSPATLPAPPLPAASPRRAPSHRPARPIARRIPVARDQRSLWEVRGWRRVGKKLVGAYRLGQRGAYAGEIDLGNPHRPQFYIINPPPAVLNGSHAACFRRRKKDRYAIHFGIGGNFSDPDAGLIAVEKLLAASL